MNVNKTPIYQTPNNNKLKSTGCHTVVMATLYLVSNYRLLGASGLMILFKIIFCLIFAMFFVVVVKELKR